MGKYTIKDLKEYAVNKGGFCLDDEYEGWTKKYTWVCKRNHIWSSSWQTVKSNNSWCGKCYLLDVSKSKHNKTWQKERKRKFDIKMNEILETLTHKNEASIYNKLYSDKSLHVLMELYNNNVIQSLTNIQRDEMTFYLLKLEKIAYRYKIFRRRPEDLIAVLLYLKTDLSQQNICSFMNKIGYNISTVTLRKIIKSLGLKKNKGEQFEKVGAVSHST